MKYPIPAFIFLGLFFISAILQLIFAFLEKESIRRKQKFTCLLFLGAFALFAFPNRPLIYIAAFFAMLGDILDLNLRTFYFGAVSFFVSHIFNFIEIITDILNFEIPWFISLTLILTFIIILVVVYLCCKNKKSHSEIDKVSQSIYFALLVSYVPLLIYASIKVGGLMFLSLIGAVFFIISDSILVWTHFGPKFKRYHFYDMVTYLIAEALLVLGFILVLAI